MFKLGESKDNRVLLSERYNNKGDLLYMEAYLEISNREVSYIASYHAIG